MITIDTYRIAAIDQLKRYADILQCPLRVTNSADDLRDFCEYSWPGNVRQLSHVIEQGYVLNTPPRVPTSKRANDNSRLPYLNLGKLQETAIRQALEVTKGHKGRAAKLLGVHANTLTRMLAQLDNAAE